MIAALTNRKTWFAILVLSVIAIVVTGHATQVRETGQTRVELFENIIQKKLDGNPDDKCTDFLVVSCPEAVTRDVTSPTYGKPNPHAKFACCNKDLCYVAVVGLRDPFKPTLVTVIPETRRALDRSIRTNKCYTSSLAWARYLYGGMVR